MSQPDDDPARGFLDQTVPRDDAWDGREPPDEPARPRHLQYPATPEPLPDPRDRRRRAVRGAVWTFGPGVAYLAGAATADDAEPEREPEPAPMVDDQQTGFGEIGSGL